MKYCSKCGKQLSDDAIFCSSCGNKCETDEFNNSINSTVNQNNYIDASNFTKQTTVTKKTSEYATVIKVFMIIGLIATAIFIIPLFWTIPMTVSAFGKMRDGEKISTGFKVCTLIFVSLIAGLFMLIDDNL